jgi:pentatricopeptide repeat protein
MRKATSIKEATKSFIGLQHLRLEDNISVFNALIRCIAKTQEWEKALHVFRHLNEIGVCANTETYNALLHACVQGTGVDVPC